MALGWVDRMDALHDGPYRGTEDNSPNDIIIDFPYFIPNSTAPAALNATPAGGAMNFYIFHGADQADAATRYRRQLERMHPAANISMTNVHFSDAFRDGWGAMGSNGDINGVIINVHGGPNRIATCDGQRIYVSDLEQQTMSWLLLLSCNTGHLDVENNVATQFARYLVNGPVISADGYHQRFAPPALPFIHNSVVDGRAFKHFAELANNSREPLGFVLFYLYSENVNHRVLDINGVWSLHDLTEEAKMHTLRLTANQSIRERAVEMGLFLQTCDE